MLRLAPLAAAISLAACSKPFVSSDTAADCADEDGDFYCAGEGEGADVGLHSSQAADGAGGEVACACRVVGEPGGGEGGIGGRDPVGLASSLGTEAALFEPGSRPLPIPGQQRGDPAQVGLVRSGLAVLQRELLEAAQAPSGSWGSFSRASRHPAIRPRWSKP